MKETTEWYGFSGSGFNAGYSVLDDGKFGFAEDIGKIVPVLLEAQGGLTGISKMKTELASATIAEKEAAKAAFDGKLSQVPEDDAYDLSAGFHGIHMLLSYGFRRGANAERARIVAKLEEAGVSASDIGI